MTDEHAGQGPVERMVRPGAEARCMCGEMLLSECPGEWEPGCDLGANRADEPVACGDDSRILHELAGAASLCWEPKPTGVFDSQKAIGFVEQALRELRESCAAAPAAPAYVPLSDDEMLKLARTNLDQGLSWAPHIVAIKPRRQASD